MTLVSGVDDMIELPEEGGRVISWLPAAHIAERGANYYLPVCKGLETTGSPVEVIEGALRIALGRDVSPVIVPGGALVVGDVPGSGARWEFNNAARAAMIRQQAAALNSSPPRTVGIPQAGVPQARPLWPLRAVRGR